MTTTHFFKKYFGRQRITGVEKLTEKLSQVLVYYGLKFYDIRTYSYNSLTQGLKALEFVFNAEVYFTQIGSEDGKKFFDLHKDEFLNLFNYKKVISNVKKGDDMFFLYDSSSEASERLNAHGVFGKFHSIERHYHWNNPYEEFTTEPGHNLVVVKFQRADKSIIDLPVIDMLYFGKWCRKLKMIA